MLLYATVLRCKIDKAYDCRLEFSPVNDTGTALSGPKFSMGAPIYTVAVPTGAVGLGYDPKATQVQ